MNKKALGKLLGICMAAFLTALNLFGQSEETSVVNGMVTNPQGLAIPKISVTFESDIWVHEILTDSDGRFTTSIPPSVYKITTSKWSYKLPYSDKNSIFYNAECVPYFRPSERASISLRANDQITLNLMIPESHCVNWNELGDFGYFSEITHTSFGTPARYRNLLPRTLSGVGFLDLVVQYSIYKEVNGVESYKMYAKTPNGIPTVLTYDHITILADEIRHDPKKKLVQTVGTVKFDDGKRQYDAKSVKITFEGNQPKFNISK